MNDALPPAASPEPRAPRCSDCQGWNILWRHDFPAEYPLTNYGIGNKFICEPCALRLVAERAKLPFGPDPQTVQALIASKQKA